MLQYGVSGCPVLGCVVVLCVIFSVAVPILTCTHIEILVRITFCHSVIHTLSSKGYESVF